MIELLTSILSTPSYEAAIRAAISERVASRLAEQDPTLWGEDAEQEATVRLSWTSLAESSRPLVSEIETLREQFNTKGLDHVVLSGMGGSSLAPEVICKVSGVELTVVDTSQPDMVRTALSDRLERSIVVVSSKSGSTMETDSHRRIFEKAFTDAGLDPADHFVVVTDPGSDLDVLATDAGYVVFRADPDVGGRYSALTAFGLVPSGLAGAPIAELLDDAEATQNFHAGDDPDNPGLRLGTLLGVANAAGVDKLVLCDQTGHGIGNWIEQLVAESTGKNGKGILPVVVPYENAVNFNPNNEDALLVTICAEEAPESLSGFSAAISGGLGGLFLTWENAIAVVGRAIGINPFDQPDVESAKQASRELLGNSPKKKEPAFSTEGIDVYGTDADDLDGAIHDLLMDVDLSHGYVSIQAYVDRYRFTDYPSLRELVAQRTGRPVTFGWGPRFLHSTGQYHKGGPANGVFLQITAEPTRDLPVPGRDFSLGEFIASQSDGDANVLRKLGRPVLHLHLQHAAAALPRLKTALS